MPAVATSTINKQGYLSTAQVQEELMVGSKKVYQLMKSGIITKYIVKGRKYCFDTHEILQIKKAMLKNGGAL